MVAKQIKDLITAQKVLPGDCIGSERDMCRNLNVSRSVLREALSGLQVQGFIRTDPSGIFVESISPHAMKEPIEQVLVEDKKKIFELTEVRKILESGMSALAIKRSTSEDREKMKEALTSCEKAFADKELGTKENVEFHLSLAKCTHNAIYIHLLYTVLDLFYKGSLMYRSKLITKPGNAEILIEQHREIYRCFFAKDPEKLNKAIIDHLLWSDNEFHQIDSEAQE